MLDCRSEEDFAAKLYVIRMAFDKMMLKDDKKQWVIEQGKSLLSNLLIRAEKVCSLMSVCRF